MAIREKKCTSLGRPRCPITPVRLYVDCEGDPERGFVYLIGLTVVGGGEESHYSFWADNETEESSIFQQFLDVVGRYPSFAVFHYGSYERAFFRRMRKIAAGEKIVDRLVTDSCNVVSVLHANIYFPTCSNGLKDVARIFRMHLVRSQCLRGNERGLAKGMGVWLRRFRQAKTHQLQHRGRAPPCGE